jgi:hypothetical protein
VISFTQRKLPLILQFLDSFDRGVISDKRLERVGKILDVLLNNAVVSERSILAMSLHREISLYVWNWFLGEFHGLGGNVCFQ